MPRNLPTIGDRIREERKARALTATAVADACGWTRQHQSALERGKWLPTLEQLIKLSTALGVEFSELITNTREWHKFSREITCLSTGL